jgi:hypothetical protein
LITQQLRRSAAHRVIQEHHIDIVHEPTPVSPRQPSFMTGLGVPVVIGPMNGRITFPPAFRDLRRCWERWMLAAIQLATGPMYYLIPGKRKAAVLLVANGRTRNALPRCVRGRKLLQLAENGVDTTTWQPPVIQPKTE